MSHYTFDGTALKIGSRMIANIKGNEIREGNGSRVIGNVKGDDIRQGNGSTTLFNIRGDDIRQGNGSTRIATMRDVDAVISGPGKIIKAALWLLLCR